VTLGRESASGGCRVAGSEAARRGGSRGLRYRAPPDVGRIHRGRPPMSVGPSVLSIYMACPGPRARAYRRTVFGSAPGKD
jgi:hypothetical protein